MVPHRGLFKTKRPNGEHLEAAILGIETCTAKLTHQRISFGVGTQVQVSADPAEW
jgi:hypothetical protein